ncbi:hypothetical protein M569_03079, partial [Genlisea aurea]
LPLILLSLSSKTHFCTCLCNAPIIFNFGDSNSDTGGISSGVGFPVNLPNGRTFFGLSTGRLSDGRLLIDFLCESINTSFLRPYLDPFDSIFTNGANFAIAGSATLPRYTPFALNIQVMQFKYLKLRSAQLAAAGSKNVIGDDMFGKALYMIDIGQNDIADSLTKGQSVKAKIPQVLAEIKGAIVELYGEGGRKFWVHNTGPIGCLPQKLADYTNRTSAKKLVDAHGCISSYNSAAKELNDGLSIVCSELRSQMKDATIVYVDIYSIKLDVIVNYTNYGLTNPLMACCGSGGPPYNYDRSVTCGFSGYEVCDATSRYVSWDGVHYTDAANSVISAKVLSMEYSTPAAGFDFFCR